ncbi:MAG TPA: thiolase family protein [Gemmatimonadota bacterium]|jgi:acetyl-CoA C-acetyltransferase
MSTRKVRDLSEIVIAGPVRTPIGKFGGAFAEMWAPELGAEAAKGALARAGLGPEHVDLVVFGHGRQAGNGPNTARQVARRAGIPDDVPAFTVNMACASSLQAIVNGLQAIALGDADVVLAGGHEAMSRTPYFLLQARWGYRLGSGELVDGMYRDGFLDPLCGQVMGETAENLVDQYEIPRSEQDAYAAESQNRAERAIAAGRFETEIVPVAVDGAKGRQTVTADEHPRKGVTVEALARLPPVFRKDGTVHAGNSSGITDGAAALVLMTREAAAEHGVQPLARVVDYVSVGVDPRIMGIGPVPAVRQLLERRGMALSDVGLVELNEAFAAQVIACDRELRFDRERLNVNGGAIALGHPIGATGTRITVTLLHEMARRDVELGLATLCVSGGMGMAVLYERVAA